MKRSAGILMAISSLPSPYGIGTFGKAAYQFADFLESAGQSYWQMLPLGPTGFGDSPYQSCSTYAGNPFFIDLDMLVEDKLLSEKDLKGIDWGKNPELVDYGKVYENRFRLLAIAKKNGWDRNQDKINAFLKENENWVYNYALFMACKRHFDMKCWMEWPDENLRKRVPETLAHYRELLKEDVELFLFIQYLFFDQWTKLKQYINAKGIKVIGDVPIYVAMDSSDMWSEPEFFLTEEDGKPKEVSGVPPDAFTKDGQLWGNPLYNWEKMEQDGFGWWIRRIGGASRLFDVIRFDHFRGLETYWAVPFGEKTAKIGEWRKGPGMKLINVLNGWFHDVSFMAEDLGILTEDVRKLLKDSGWPGMKVLVFAFNAGESSSYLPHKYEKNCVCYTGTHDNNTVEGWMKAAKKADAKFAQEYLGLSEKETYSYGFIRGGMCSNADLFIAQMQDYLCQDDTHRMNAPGTFGGQNWQYRMKEKELTPKLAAKIRSITEMYGRM